MKLLTKRDLFEKIEDLSDELKSYQEEMERIKGQNATKDATISNLKDVIRDVFYTLKEIKNNTKDSTIKTLCVLQMQSIKQISCVYMGVLSEE